MAQDTARGVATSVVLERTRTVMPGHQVESWQATNPPQRACANPFYQYLLNSHTLLIATWSKTMYAEDPGWLKSLVGANMRSAREDHGWSQTEFGQRLDPPVGQRQVSLWECGVNKPRDDRMPQIARVLERPVWWFCADHTQPELAV